MDGQGRKRGIIDSGRLRGARSEEKNGEWGGLNTRLNDAAIIIAGVAYQRIPTHHMVIVGRKEVAIMGVKWADLESEPDGLLGFKRISDLQLLGVGLQVYECNPRVHDHLPERRYGKMGRELARSDFEPSTAGVQHRIPALELENEEDPPRIGIRHQM
ncbi:hypothetical protein B0H14DRAFT_2640175 [Mycena olivaceomarginata]|nr:hypothetical protein B0H14DRAFT_2640175 [Mycena olivaceomarginata]